MNFDKWLDDLTEHIRAKEQEKERTTLVPRMPPVLTPMWGSIYEACEKTADKIVGTKADIIIVDDPYDDSRNSGS